MNVDVNSYDLIIGTFYSESSEQTFCIKRIVDIHSIPKQVKTRYNNSLYNDGVVVVFYLLLKFF